MKQGMRLVMRPGQFFNQLQWSRNHGIILFAFLIITAIEAHLGRSRALYEAYASFLSHSWGIGAVTAMWLVVTAKLFVILFGAVVISQVIWMVGNLFGHKHSKRVLFRRLAVVFTVVLTAYTAGHLESIYPWMGSVSFFFYAWGVILGYFALKEQFDLALFETLLVGAFAVLVVLTSWSFANHTLEEAAKAHMAQMAMQPKVVQKIVPTTRF